LIAGAKTEQFAIGLTAPAGAAGRVAFSFAQKMPKGVLDVAAAATQTNTGIAYTYNLSKRTSISGGVAYVQNLGMVDGVNVTQIGGGILHSF
jgi:predicted porin